MIAKYIFNIIDDKLQNTKQNELLLYSKDNLIFFLIEILSKINLKKFRFQLMYSFVVFWIFSFKVKLSKIIVLYIDASQKYLSTNYAG